MRFQLKEKEDTEIDLRQELNETKIRCEKLINELREEKRTPETQKGNFLNKNSPTNRTELRRLVQDIHGRFGKLIYNIVYNPLGGSLCLCTNMYQSLLASSCPLLLNLNL